jgi:hypothetical protein
MVIHTSGFHVRVRAGGARADSDGGFGGGERVADALAGSPLLGCYGSTPLWIGTQLIILR